MSENENQQSTIAANLCNNGCGFYGSTQFDGMCSVCHKEVMKKRQKLDEDQIQKPMSSPHSVMLCTSTSTSSQPQPQSSSLATAPVTVGTKELGSQHASACAASTKLISSIIDTGSVSSSVTESSGSTLDSSASQPQRKRVRCGVCKKKVGLTGFDCRCGGVYCPAHRYSDKHSCQFDYQTHGQDEIRKANPQVVSSKIEKL